MVTKVIRTEVAARPRGFVGVTGPHAAAYLQRMLSNDVDSLPTGRSCDALLLTPKARVIAPVRVLRRADDDFLLLTEPELAEALRDSLLRSRFAARADIALEEHESFVLFAPSPPDGALAARTEDYGASAWEVVDAAPPDDAVDVPPDALEARRIRAGTPRFGRELDDRVLPAEAGLVERAVSLSKGCYPGQEPIARLHYRGHANRSLRVLSIAGDGVPGPETDVRYREKTVGRVTSAVAEGGAVVALAYVRVEVPPDAVLDVGGTEARPLH